MSKLLKKRIVFPIIGALAFVFSLVWAFASTPNTYAATTVVEVATLTKEIMLNNMNKYQYEELYGGEVTINGIKFRWNRILPSGNNLTLPSNYDNYFVAEGLDQTVSLLDISMTFGNTNSGNLVFDVSDRFVFNESLSGKTGYSKYNVAATGYNRNSVCLLFDRTGDSPETELIVTSLTLTLKAEVTTEKVTLDKQSGTGGSSSIDAAPGSAMPSITVPTRTGYTFGGYYTGKNGSGTKYYNADGSSATNWVEGAATTLYAKWTAKTCTVTLDRQSGTGGSSSVTATYASAMPSMTSPSRTGYTFGGYYTEANGGGTKYYNADGTSAKNWDKTSATTLYAKWTLLPVIQDVIDKINAIGTVQYTSVSKGLINTARSAYDALSEYDALNPSYKSLVSNYQTLTTAETTYENLRTGAINDVKSLIGSIGTVTYPDSKAAIEVAETGYSHMDDADKSEITNYETLTAARAEYDSQKAVAVQNVIAAIDAIGEVKYPNSKEAIINAETLYNALDEDEKNTTVIPNYETMTGDRAAFDDLRAAAIQDVIDKIDAIAIPLVYPNSNTDITTARNAFDALHNDDKNDTVIPNYPDLLDVEAAYSVVKEVNEIGNSEDTEEFRDKVSATRNNYNNLTDAQKTLFPNSEYNSLVNYEKGISVMDLINAIGDVVITPVSKALIDAANDAYAELTDVQKALVVNYGNLVQANTDYDAALIVVNKIDAIGDGEYNEEKQAKITDARENFNELTPYQQSIVYNYQKLFDEEVEATETLIKNIGSVQYTSVSKALIDKATASYNALDPELKTEVENYDQLLKANYDYNKVDTFVKDVNNLGNLTYSDACNNKIKNARKLIDDLNSDQKAILPSESENTLVNYEKSYAAIEKINSIGDVEYSTETEELIKEAREAYDGLSPEQKKLINNEDTTILTTKEEELDSKTTTAITGGIILTLLASLAICAAIFFIFFLLFKRDDDDDDENKNIQKPNVVKASSSILPLVILASHFGTGPYRAFYILLIIAALAWIGVLVIYILKKKGIIKTIRFKSKKDKKEE